MPVTHLYLLLCLSYFVFHCSLYADLFEEGMAAYIEEDYQKALEKWSSKSLSSDAMTQFNLGVMHELGLGVKKDFEKSIEKYKLAADQGLAPAQYNLGLAYYFGQGLKKNLQQTKKWWEKSAEQGHAEAQYNLGALIWSENDTSKADSNKEIALSWLRKAAAQKQLDAINFLENYSNYDQDNVKQQFAYRSAGRFSDNPLISAESAITFDLAVRAYESGEHRLAFKYWIKLAVAGHAESQYRLAHLYESGTGVEKNEDKAIKLYQQAAENGFNKAQFRLGRYHIEDTENKDILLGWYWIQSAADGGLDEAKEFIKKTRQ